MLYYYTVSCIDGAFSWDCWLKMAKDGKIGQNIKTTIHSNNTRDRFRSRRKRGNQNHQLGILEMNVNIQMTNFAGLNKVNSNL